MTILVIDDDRSVYETIEAVLTDDGYHCLTAKDTHEADLVLETVPVHGMTLDLEIREGEPMKWVEEIALMLPELARRTILLTGNSLSEADRRRIQETGAGLLLKPFTVGELREVILGRIGSVPDRSDSVKPPAGSFRPIRDESD